MSDPVLAPLPPARPYDLLGVGECSLDQLLVVDALPAPGGKTPATEWRELAGGQVATAVLAAARLGLSTAYAGAVGEDARADRVLEPLRAMGVDLSQVETVSGAATRAAVIVVERATGERTVLGHRDEKLAQARTALAGLELGKARLLLLDGSDLPLATALAERARRLGLSVVLDLDVPAPGFERLLAHIDYPVVSKGFAQAAYGSAERALVRLAALGARFPVVTLGAAGALASGPGGLVVSPAFPVEAVDTTGAGDVFHGTFAWGLLQGLDATALLRAANAAAGLACTGLGAQAAIPDTAQLEAFVRAGGRRYSSS